MVDDIIIVKQLNQVYLQLQVNTSQALELKDYFSVYVPNYLYHPKYRAHLWSGKVSFFDVRGGLLPIGLLNKFFDFCEQYNYSYKLDFDKTNFFLNIDKDKLEEFYNKILEPVKEKYTLRDYQKESIFKLLSQKKGIVEHATGSGKSLVIYMIIRFLRIFFDAKILLVVPTTNLVEQMYTDFSDYGWKEVGD
ncbi:MAG: DEAD/DEAH box helicase family protein, partial [Candidatus Woesearchaeota archaeon]